MSCDPINLAPAACAEYIREYVHLDDDNDDDRLILDKDSPVLNEFADDDDDESRFGSMEYGLKNERPGSGGLEMTHILDESFDSHTDLKRDRSGGGRHGVLLNQYGGRRRRIMLIALLCLAVIVGAVVGIARAVQRRNDSDPSSENIDSEARSQERSIQTTEGPTLSPIEAEVTDQSTDEAQDESGEFPALAPIASTEPPTSAEAELVTTVSPTSEPTAAVIDITPTPTASPSMVPTGLPTRAPTSAPTRAPTRTPTTDAPTASPTIRRTPFPTLTGERITVGAYYYAAYGQNSFFTSDDYLRGSLGQQPTLGEYGKTDAAIIKRHLEWSRKANVNLWVTSYSGEGSPEDSNLQNIIFPHEDLRDMRIALMYDTRERIKASENYSTQRVKEDMRYMCNTYFARQNYYHIDGRPVVVIYLSRVLEQREKLVETISLMRSIDGCNPYLIGDHAFHIAPDIGHRSDALASLDAITNFDVYGSMEKNGAYAGEESVDEYYVEQTNWRLHAILHGIGFVPSVTPGFNNRAYKPESNLTPLARRLTRTSDPGTLFQSSLWHAKNQVDSRVDNLLLVNSWNKWNEDTQIEPVNGATTSTPQSLTRGVVYEGYGERYLNILYEETFGRIDR